MNATCRFLPLVMALAFFNCWNQSASAQPRGNPRLFGVIPAVTLAQLEEVQSAVKLTDDQKKAVAQLQEDLNSDRGELFQDAAGDFEKIGAGMTKLYSESAEKINAKLEESQSKRLQEIYLQVNDAMALMDAPIQEMLNVSSEQKSKLQDALNASREKMFSAFQDFQNMTPEERAKAGNEMVKTRDESLLSVMNDDQKKSFHAAKGQTLEIDLSKLPGPGGR